MSALDGRTIAVCFTLTAWDGPREHGGDYGRVWNLGEGFECVEPCAAAAILQPDGRWAWWAFGPGEADREIIKPEDDIPRGYEDTPELAMSAADAWLADYIECVNAAAAIRMAAQAARC